jgi:genome maintenance exonuclease 1
MYIEKYQYQSLSRESVNGRRLYATPDGLRLPSVTTILDATKSQEKIDTLENWRKAIGHKKAQQITTEAANRGTRMHSYLETYIKQGFMSDRGSNPYSWASHEMARTVIDQGLCHVTEFWGVEIPLYFPKIYAGTTDCVGIHKGRPSIIDFKQTNKPKRESWIDDYKLQLVAYALAHNEVYGTDISKGVILMCVKPDLDDNQMLLSQPQYQEFEISGAEFGHWRQQWWIRLEQFYQHYFDK